jgi:L-lactate dehydrogenase complex protein LldF
LLCIRCGACLNACPVFREIGGHAYVGKHGEISTYPGPIGSIISPGLFYQSEFGHLARASSLCGACIEACPVDIDLPKLLLRVRAGGIKMEPIRAKQTLPGMVALGISTYTWFSIEAKRFRFAQHLLGLISLSSPHVHWIRLPALPANFTARLSAASLTSFQAGGRACSQVFSDEGR